MPCKKLKKIYKVDPEKNASQVDRQMNRTDFTGPIQQRCKFDHVFRKFENKIFISYLA